MTEIKAEHSQDSCDPEQIEAIRKFNRVYAQKAGAFTDRLYDSTFSLTELRILYELSLHESTTATYLSKAMDLDCGYLSRILNGFEKLELITKERSAKDARQRTISLTERGRAASAKISARVVEDIDKMLKPLTTSQRETLVAAMNTIVAILSF